MNIPLLRHLPGFAGRPVREIVVLSTSEKASSEAALRYLLAELPELHMAAVVGVAAGKLLAAYAAERSWWPEAVAAPHAAIIRQVQAALAAQGASPEELEEVLVTLGTQLHLLRLRPGGQQVLCLAIDARDTNLAIAREVMRESIRRLATSPA